MARGHPRSGVASPTSPAPAGCSAWSSGCDRQAAHSCSSMKKVSLLMAASHRDPHEMPRLKASLRLNDLATDKQLEQFDVHYRFLSSSIHWRKSQRCYTAATGLGLPTTTTRASSCCSISICLQPAN